jgi:hypothetical protein
MAEFALGLTKTAVEGTLSLVKSAVEEEKKLRKEVQNDLVFISGELEMMQSFLRVTNKERVGNDEVVLTWVRQLRNVAFDVEDCVEFVVHLEIKSLCCGCLRRACQKVCYCLSPLPLDVAIAEIKQLKARVEDVSQRNTRYNLILHGSNNNNRQQPAVTVVMPPLAEQPEDATTYPSSDCFHILRNAWKPTGNWCHNMSNLQDLIGASGDDGLQVISVWGSTVGDDLGTTSILTKAYWDPEICEKFKSRAWVKLMHPFNHDEFVKSLLAQFYASSSHQANDADAVDFREEDKLLKLMQEMREQRYLVVLENVVAVAQWNVIRMYLPNSKNGSRIVISTPQLGIALLCAGEPFQVSELTKFHGDNQFLCAFFKNKVSHKFRSNIGVL